MKKEQFPLYFAVLFGAAAAIVRFWMASSARNDKNLPVFSHPSTYLLCILFLAVCAAAVWCFSVLRQPQGPEILSYTKMEGAAGMAGGILILVSACAEFVEALRSGSSMLTALVFLAMLLSGICMIISAYLRKQHNLSFPLCEILILICMTFILVIRFKTWSTDPIVLDYFFDFLALLLALLSFHASVGCLFSHPTPKRALLFTMACVTACGAAMGESVQALSLSGFLQSCGYLIWSLPVLRCLTMQDF